MIVTYNSGDTVLNCIRSIYENIKDINYEVLVIDNLSTDGTPLKIIEEFPKVKMLINEENLGFGKANNIGFKNASGEYILVLNPDTRVIEKSIENMIKFMGMNKDVGILTCKLLNFDDSIQYSARRFISLFQTIFYRTPIKKIMPQSQVNKLNNYYLMKDWDHNSNKEIDWAIGACLLLPKKIIDTLEGFDDRFFMYYEDVDLCLRTKREGYKIFYLADVNISHEHIQASTKNVNKLSIIHFKSMIKFYKKYNSLIFNNKR